MPWFFIVLYASYSFALILLIWGWNKSMGQSPPTGTLQAPSISIIVPVRNEGKNIGNLLESLALQEKASFEVIVVNDHSTDMTGEIVQIWIKKAVFPLRWVNLVGGEGKKQALTEGIRQAQGPVILTTDGDCVFPPQAVAIIADRFKDGSCQMVVGGVGIKGDSGFFSQLQGMEWLSLMGTALSTLTLGIPTFCSGANLSFRKSVFEECGGYAGNAHIDSGDDEFLLRKVFARYPKGVCSLPRPEAVVTTLPQISFRAFVHQRLRWASKWKHHREWGGKAMAMYVAFFQGSQMPFFLAWAMGWIDFRLALGLFLAKASLEFVFLKKASGFLRQDWQWGAFLFLLLAYPFYAVGIGVASLFYSGKWKGREVKG